MGPVTLASVTTSGGPGTGAAGGAAGGINITSGDAGSDSTNDVTLTASLTAGGGLGASSGVGGTITIAADGGVIDANSSGNDLTATSLVITGATGVGAADPIETSAQFFDIVNSGPARDSHPQ